MKLQSVAKTYFKSRKLKLRRRKIAFSALGVVFIVQCIISRLSAVGEPPNSLHLAPIPNIVHFLHGLSSSPEKREFELVHHLAVIAVRERLRPSIINVHFIHEPSSYWWNATKHLVTPVRVGHRDLLSRILHHAHKADFLRLLILEREGGLYLDMDVIVLKQLTGFTGNKVLLGEEGVGGLYGFSNAIIASPKGSHFIKTWLEITQRTFSNEKWNDHSIQLPKILAREFEDQISVQNHEQFCWPLWDSEGLSQLYLSNDCDFTSTSQTVHLWHHKVHTYLQNLTVESILRHETCFTKLARQFIPSSMLPGRLLHFQSLTIIIEILDAQGLRNLAPWCHLAQYYGARVVFQVLKEEYIQPFIGHGNKCGILHMDAERVSKTRQAESLSRGNESEWYIFFDSALLVSLLGLRDSLQHCPSFAKSGTYLQCISAYNERNKSTRPSGSGCVTIFTAEGLTQESDLRNDLSCNQVTSFNFSREGRVPCGHLFSNIVTGLQGYSYPTMIRLMYLSGLPSAENIMSSLDRTVCSEDDLSDLLQKFSSVSSHSQAFSENMDENLVMMPRKLDAIL